MRTLYLIAYDVCDPRRLARVHRYLLGYKVGGQKSVYECWLTRAELAVVRADLADLIDPSCDRVHFFQMDPRLEMIGYGLAQSFTSGFFSIV